MLNAQLFSDSTARSGGRKISLGFWGVMMRSVESHRTAQRHATHIEHPLKSHVGTPAGGFHLKRLGAQRPFVRSDSSNMSLCTCMPRGCLAGWPGL